MRTGRAPVGRPVGTSRRGRTGRRGGYTLVILMVLIAVMSIGLAAAGPYWSKIIQREKEEELIFRGMQYAEAIRVFQARFGRPPNRLEELLEAEPRSIRQLWDDPMTEHGKWLILSGAGQGGQPGGQQAPGVGGAQGTGPGGKSVEEWAQEFQAGGAPGAQSVEEWSQEFQAGAGGESVEEWASNFGREQIGPLQGVSSRSDEESYRIFRGNDHYNQWQFTPELVPGTDGAEGQPRAPYIGTSWMTRNLPTKLAQAGSGSGIGDLFGKGDSGGEAADGQRGENGEEVQDDPFADFGDGEAVEEGADDPFDFDFQSEEDLQELEDLFLEEEGGGGGFGGG